MDDASQSLVGWRELARAIPGAVGVQVDDEFAYVSAALASALSVDAGTLTGRSWCVPFDPPETSRLEGAVADARETGRWDGEVSVDDGQRSVDLTLSATDTGALVWTVADAGDSGGGGSDAGGSAAVTADGTDGAATGTDTRSSSDGHAGAPTGRQPPREVRPQIAWNVIDAVDDVLYAIDEDGHLYLWNETLAETTGYDHEEIDSMHPMELIPEDQHEYVPGLMEAIDAIEDRRVEVDILTKDGERVPHEFQGTTVEDPETGRTFRCGLARDVTERRARTRELERYETIIETVDDGVYALDETLRFSFVNDALCEMLEEDRADVLGTSVESYFTYEDELAAADDLRRRIVENDTTTGTVQATISTSDGERSLESRYRLHPEPDDDYRGSVGVIRDVTDREERERTLERQRDELATLDRINELLMETTREVVETASREAVERTVCERLAASDFYRFAWVGEREFEGDRIVPRTTAGEDDGRLDERPDATDGDGIGGGPVERALEDGEVQVTDADDARLDPLADPDGEDGVGSVAAVPLHDDGTVYGVLVVHATREGAFSERERAGFDVLGRTVGSVIHAAKNRQLLFADAVVELQFRTTDADALFVRTAAELECTFELAGYVPSGPRWVLYLEVDGASPNAVVERVAADPRVERARTVEAEGDHGRIELVTTESVLLYAVTGAGGTVRKAAVDPDGIDLVAEAPLDVEVREFVEHVQSASPESRLVARRRRDGKRTPIGLPGGVLSKLTERQREVLEAAYRAGYFTWPRDSTAEEVAEALDLAAPTLHAHLRKAEGEILSALLDIE